MLPENETRKHILVVSSLINFFAKELLGRGSAHDASKLEEPEKSGFDEWTKKLGRSTYGSDEYKQFLKEMKPFLDHHYANNRHHPEYHENGLRDMNLVDLVEMLVDWKAATLRHADGDMLKSIEINQKRFGYSDDIKQLLKNTANLL